MQKIAGRYRVVQGSTRERRGVQGSVLEYGGAWGSAEVNPRKQVCTGDNGGGWGSVGEHTYQPKAECILFTFYCKLTASSGASLTMAGDVTLIS